MDPDQISNPNKYVEPEPVGLQFEHNSDVPVSAQPTQGRMKGRTICLKVIAMTPGDEMLPTFSCCPPVLTTGLVSSNLGFQQTQQQQLLSLQQPAQVSQSAAINQQVDPFLTFCEEEWASSSFLTQLNETSPEDDVMAQTPANTDKQRGAKRHVSSAQWEMARQLTSHQSSTATATATTWGVETKPIVLPLDSTGFMSNPSSLTSHGTLVQENTSLNMFTDYDRTRVGHTTHKMNAVTVQNCPRSCPMSRPSEDCRFTTNPGGALPLLQQSSRADHCVSRPAARCCDRARARHTSASAAAVSTCTLPLSSSSSTSTSGDHHDSAEHPVVVPSSCLPPPPSAAAGVAGAAAADRLTLSTDIDFSPLEYPVKMHTDNPPDLRVLPPSIDFPQRRRQPPQTAVESRPVLVTPPVTQPATSCSSVHASCSSLAQLTIMKSRHRTEGTAAAPRSGRARVRYYSGPPGSHHHHHHAAESLTGSTAAQSTSLRRDDVVSGRRPLSGVVRRRLRSLGMEDYDTLSEQYELDYDNQSPEDDDRRLRRREQNKLAAQRCRERKKAASQNLVKEYQRLECDNTDLRYEIRNLEREQKKLTDVYRQHLPACSKNLVGVHTDTKQHPSVQHSAQQSVDLQSNVTAQGGQDMTSSGLHRSVHNVQQTSQHSVQQAGPEEQSLELDFSFTETEDLLSEDTG